ncbi:MAG TPA: D-Ala-D-Ala carboxypeptidase family metallohydrolase [Longimicrobiales bacterium]
MSLTILLGFGAFAVRHASRGDGAAEAAREGVEARPAPSAPRAAPAIDGGGAASVPVSRATRALPGAGAAALEGIPAPASPQRVGAPAVRLGPEAFGRSGALRTWQAMPGERVELPLEWMGARPAEAWYRWVSWPASERGEPAPLGEEDAAVAPSKPGVYGLEIGDGDGSRVLEGWRLVVWMPRERKKGAYLRGYRIGWYPDADGAPTERYAPPAGFIEVTPENQELRLSTHFKVREFLTKDQRSVWPKYVAIDPRLLDKLELVIQDLEARGIRADHLVVMSGFRTPQYNRKGLNLGRAVYSRHQYGDAADVWVDNDLDWYMDDLNGDGRRNTADARVMLESVRRVEARYPELVGGAGIYRDNGVHGPFIHIDARGYRARW